MARDYEWVGVPEDYYFEIDRSFVVSPVSPLTINGGRGGIPCLYDAESSLITEALGYFIERTVKYRRRHDPLTYELTIAWVQERGFQGLLISEARLPERDPEVKGMTQSLPQLPSGES